MKGPLKYSRLVVGSLLLCTIPSFMVYPQQPNIPTLSVPAAYVGTSPFIQRLFTADHVLSYDAVVELIEKIENDELSETCTPEDRRQISRFLAYLARQGMPTNATGAEQAILESDIQELFNPLPDLESASYFIGSGEYMIIPALYYGGTDAVLCRSWVSKQWKQTKKFVKRHKVAVIIGAVLVVAAVVVVVSLIAASSTAAAVGAAIGAASSDSKSSGPDPKNDSEPNEDAEQAVVDQIATLKIAADQSNLLPLIPIANESNPFEGDNARIIGSALAHEAISNVFSNSSTPNPEALDNAITAVHGSIDQVFSTDQSIHYLDPDSSFDDFESHLQKNVFHRQGEQALKQGNYAQAINDFGKAIEIDSQNHEAYLQRAFAFMEMGEYEHSLNDYRMYTAHEPFPSQPPSALANTIDFSVGFVHGVPKGAFESGHQLVSFASDVVVHPIDTSCNVCSAFATLAGLACSEEWAALSQSIAPEVCQLVDEWNSISSREQGERSGYIFGKYGGDILIPGATAKVLSKGLKGAKEIALAARNLQTAEQTFVLEGLAQSEQCDGSFAQMMAKSATKEYTPAEIAAIRTKDLPSVHESDLRARGVWEDFQRCKKAEILLKPAQNKYLPEAGIRELIHDAGMPTFPRPPEIPENFHVKLSEKGAGMMYIHPSEKGTSIRVMPGKPHSPNPVQQKPYVTVEKNSCFYDKYGNIVNKKSPEAHIPLDEFIYREY